MKLNRSKIPLNELIHRNKIISQVINISFFIFLTAVRIYCKIFSNKTDNVLVISLHKLGDTIFTFPAIIRLEKQFGKKIKIICYPESLPIYKLLFKELDYLTIEASNFYFGGRMVSKKARGKIKSLKPSLIVDITGTMVSASLIFNSRAEKIVGSNGLQFKSIYDEFVDFRKAPQLKDIYLDVISTIVDTSYRSFGNSINIQNNSNGKILIQPFAGWKEKEWNLMNYIMLGERLNKEYDVSIIVQTGQLEVDIQEEIKSMGMNVIKTDSSNDLIEQIKNCSLFIGNDSGPINIANYLSKSTLTIYGATNPAYTASNVEFQDHFIKELKCSAKDNEKCCSIGIAVYKCSGIQCMNSITVEDAFQRLKPLVYKYCVRKN